MGLKQRFWNWVVKNIKANGMSFFYGPRGYPGPQGVAGKGFSDNEKLLICYHEGAHKVETHGAWFDLAVPQDVTLKTGEFKIIPFNISIKMPKEYEGYIVPRSSTFKKWGILQTNTPGVIESLYCGNGDVWGMPVYATRDVTIPDGTRIAQFRIQYQQPHIVFEEVESMPDPDRGGYGSTGEKAAE